MDGPFLSSSVKARKALSNLAGLAALATANTQCEVEFDPSVCGGLPSCEEAVLELQQDCKDTASFEHASCVSACEFE